MRAKYFSDEDLVLYVDGKSDKNLTDEIRKALEQDDELRRRIYEHDIDLNELGSAYEQFLSPPAQDLFIQSSIFTLIRPYIRVASLILAMGIGALSNSWFNSPSLGWQNYVASYQMLYSPKTLSYSNLNAIQKQEQLTKVTAAIGKKLSVADLKLMPGLTYERAQLLSYKGQPLVQLAFTTSTGIPLALCIIASESATKTVPNFSEMEGLSAATWELPGYEYILIGGEDSELISRMASIYAGVQL